MPEQDRPSSSSASSHRLAWVVTAVAAGIAGGLLAPLVYPAIARNARPAARRALKAGIAAFEHGRELAAEVAEQASDLVAEAQAAYDSEKKLASGNEQLPPSAKEVVRLRGSGRESTAT
jgi:hypothetical protein